MPEYRKIPIDKCKGEVIAEYGSVSKYRQAIEAGDVNPWCSMWCAVHDQSASFCFNNEDNAEHNSEGV